MGTLRFAPGTAGSVVGLAVGVVAARMLSNPIWYVLLALGLLVLGVIAAQRVERSMGITDPSAVVIDEVVGMIIALFALPHRGGVLLAVFGCFRGFDIYKPFPIRRLERAPGGWGIMLDDVMAGIYANAVVRGGLWALGTS